MLRIAKKLFYVGQSSNNFKQDTLLDDFRKKSALNYAFLQRFIDFF